MAKIDEELQLIHCAECDGFLVELWIEKNARNIINEMPNEGLEFRVRCFDCRAVRVIHVDAIGK